ncbi:TPA: hypothetical protein R1W76_004601 [Citrobacter freundii]|uniref:Uncharacterized protein n=1 Tax=Citrobacter freundii TaxID=546 RepID=A0AAI9HMY0_CITFR|nr:hypothetical protein [Citrobacter freundii]EKW4406445.1 hypothetical protein [Citrobacter freundii]HCT6247185.1 hypothetical protein [Citrobacter freundii]HEC0305234.1 hypothetical protein [Citrobacter freundii]HEC1368528.1 hypothetical protein [Citrobacter freundii]
MGRKSTPEEEIYLGEKQFPHLRALLNVQ